MNVLEIKDAWEMYRLKFVEEGKTFWDTFWALKGISFMLTQGETLGIIGENGAGKSTLLKLIAGMLKPDRGELKVNGKVCGLLELGGGFQPELTGRENVFLNASLFGLSQQDIQKRYERIVEFASLGRFINAPVKCYSQGMFVRLAFSIAIHMDPDILLIDDTLSVGDEYFQGKCIKKIFELKEAGKTIIVVTHDMNLLSRLCKRTILLKEGRMIKDDRTEKVVPLYTQMEGAKQSVGVLTRGELQLIFNSGRMFLNWNETLLTPGTGAYVVFRAQNKWYSSIQAEWEVRKTGERELEAIGEFYHLALKQIWRIRLDDANQIDWSIDMELMQPLDIKEGHVNILLEKKYLQWCAPDDKGSFPEISKEERNWQELLNPSYRRKCIAVMKQQSKKGILPSLVFEKTDYESFWHAQVLNTDYMTCARVLQFRTWSVQNSSVACGNRFNYFSGKLMINIKSIEKHLERLQDAQALGTENGKLIFERGQVVLVAQAKVLSKATHMSSSFSVNGKRYYSHLAQWKIEKNGKDELFARGSWRNLPLELQWRIEQVSAKSFRSTIALEPKEKMEITEGRLQLMCSGEYDTYTCDYGSGSFNRELFESETDILQRCIPDGPIGVAKKDNALCNILVRFSPQPYTFAKILNSDFYHKARILRIERVQPEMDAIFLPGSHQFISAEITMGEQNTPLLNETNSTLRSKDLSFVFDRGRGILRWRGKTITKGIGFYTSLRSRGRWHDSYTKALWKIEEASERVLRLKGKWLHVPITQSWQVRFNDNGECELEVSMKVEEKIEVERLQANLMLSEKYDYWLAGSKEGSFPEFKADLGDDWDHVYKAEEQVQQIAAFSKDGHLPSVMLVPNKKDSQWRLHVVNSDLSQRGRVLQYLNDRIRVIAPGEYTYFRGLIRVKGLNEKE